MKRFINLGNDSGISYSKKMFIDRNGNLRIRETEWEKFYRTSNKFQFFLGSYLAIVTAVAMYPICKWLFSWMGIPSEFPFAIKAILYLTIVIKACQLGILLLNQLTKDSGFTSYKKPRHFIKKQH